MNENKVSQLSPLSLAFVGDAVFTLFVRTRLAACHDDKPKSLHLLANRYVKATAQAKILDALSSSFTQEEADIARRARNSHNPSKAKNAGLAEYRKATSFEAVLGYLHLSEQAEREIELMERAAQIIENDEGERYE